MKPLLGILVIFSLVLSQAGCGKKQEPLPVAEQEVMETPAELPALDQNRVAPNPFFIPTNQEIPFEPVNDEAQKEGPAEDELAVTETPAGD